MILKRYVFPGIMANWAFLDSLIRLVSGTGSAPPVVSVFCADRKKLIRYGAS
jgi:hypothetical protein